MSGGVDSSVAAALLLEQGYHVQGITMRVLPVCDDDHDSTVTDARAVADHLGIPHHVIDLHDTFEKNVIQYFVHEYAAGLTPNPCVRCNRQIKFGVLREKANNLGAQWIATGHYVRKARVHDRWTVRRAACRAKDQSYVLAVLTQEQLASALFPLGDIESKETARARARDLGLNVAEREESQECCFIPNDDYRAFLASRQIPSRPGPIMSTDGRVLGEHTGLPNYTIGQRRGLGIPAERPLYVIRMDTRANTLIVGFEEETYCRGLIMGDLNWCGMAPTRDTFASTVQIRYLHKPVQATVSPEPGSKTARITFADAQRAVTPGQWAVLYDADWVVAGGTILGSF